MKEGEILPPTIQRLMKGYNKYLRPFFDGKETAAQHMLQWEERIFIYLYLSIYKMYCIWILYYGKSFFTFEISLPIITFGKVQKKTSINTDMTQSTKFIYVQMSI